METAIGEPGALCSDCESNGCEPNVEGERGSDCRAPCAYGCFEGCEHWEPEYPSEHEMEGMRAKGYRHCLLLSGGIPPIYAKSPDHAARLMRELYPNERILGSRTIAKD